MNHRPKLKEDDIGENLYDLVLGRDFIDNSTESMSHKRINKLSFIKIKNLCSLKYPV